MEALGLVPDRDWDGFNQNKIPKGIEQLKRGKY